MNHTEYLTGPVGGDRVGAVRNFLKNNQDLVGIEPQNVDTLKVGADYTNPDGNLSYVRLEQEINGIPVFRGELTAGFTKDNRIIRMINNLAPGVDSGNVSIDFGDPEVALKSAASHIGWDLTPAETARNSKASDDNLVKWGREEFSPSAEKMYFPTEPGVAVPAWRVSLIRQDGYYVIVDAHTGTILWHKQLLDHQTQAATYNVYRNAAGYIDVADSVAPLSPYTGGVGPDPAAGTQGTLISRVNRTFIGNEGSNSFNNNGWITDDTNITDGNNTEAGLDRVAPDGVDAPLTGDTACPGAGCRVFSSLWNPPPGSPAPGDEPLTAEAQRGAVIQMFYVMNMYHDELYKRGFTEQARNFQHSNFGRGGVEADRVRSEGQDSSGTNNANFLTQADGARGRMQMYIWTGPTPDRDGTGDADIMIHEVSHGLSNRLHGNASGLGGMGGMMGEGWGDWYAHTLLAQESDPVDGVYGMGGYSLYQVAGLTGFTANYYYGIRKWPKAVISSTGGPNRPACNNGPCPHNPLSFRHINTGCFTELGNSTTANISAFPLTGAQSAVISATCNQVHNAGEIWSSALWEVRARIVTRLGFADGTTRALQVVTDGMKLSPLNPTFLQGRDAIIAAAAAISFNGTPETSADVADVREGFRVRGMGFSASVQSTSAVTESFDFPNVRQVDPFSVSEAPTGNDGDGFPEPGENVLLSVAVTNPSTGSTINNVQVNVNGGANVSYGDITDGQTVTNQIPYTVPGGAQCGSMHQVTINVSSSVGAQTPVNKEFRLGAPVGGAPVSFTNSTGIDMPNGQPTTTSGPSNPYPSTINVSGLTGNKLITLTLNNFRHEFEDDVDMLLVGPGGQKFIFMSDVGGVTEQLTPITFSIADSGATLLPDATAIVNGTTYRPSNVGANDPFDAPAPAAPYENAAPGGAATFASVFGTTGSALNGTWSLYIDDDAGGDPGRIEGGWTLTFEANDFNCGAATAVSVSGRVVSPNGRGIAGAYVNIEISGTTRVTRTSSFGYFSFIDLAPGVQYTISPAQKRFTFTPQQVTPTTNVTGMTFTGTPSP